VLRKALAHIKWRRKAAARWGILGFLAVAATASAQLPFPRIDTSFPLGAKVGTEVEVTVAGVDLADISTLLFTTPGVSVVKLDGLKFKVVVAPDCPRGLHEFRAVGKFGVSTPRPFVVGDADEVIDTGANHTAATAISLVIPSVVQGRVEPEQRDTFKFRAARGEVVHLSCVSFALDSPVDPVMTVADASGRTLGRADDERDRDAVLTFTAPGDGEYLVSVHDKLFTGGAGHLYRLAISRTPVEIPLRTPASAPELPGTDELTETEPNDTPASAQPLELPALIRGTFDNDNFSFRAEAGSSLWIEVRSERDGVSCDPVLTISKVARDAQGNEQAKPVLELDDQAEPPLGRWMLGSLDPAGVFRPDETATYRVRVNDRFAGFGSYRLLIRAAVPDFALVAFPDSPANEEKKLFMWQPNARRGGSAVFAIAVLRRGYDGEIKLSAEGLPEGIAATGFVPAGAQTGWLTFTTTPDAKPWAGYPRVVGEGGGVKREIQATTYRWGVENRDNQRLAAHLSKLAVGVIDEQAPIVIAPVEQKTWESAIGGTLEIPLKITRSGQPKGEWQIVPAAFPGLAKIEPLKIDGAAATEAKLVISFQNKDGNNFVPGTYPLALRARGTVTYKADEKAQPKDVPHVEIFQPFTVTLTAPATAAK
jgi:hypothetical protein